MTGGSNAPCLIFTCYRAILHDPSVYSDPDAFNPDRFLDEHGLIDPQIPDPVAHVFGHGRRVCPGRHFVLTSIWQHIASILANFEILPAKDDEGRTMLPTPAYTSGLIRYTPGF